MKVFISHKKENSEQAKVIRYFLEQHGVPSFLDIVDEVIVGKPDHIVDYIIKQLEGCTHLLPVVSSVTQLSWWVPFEIGVGTEKGMPITTFIVEHVKLPEFLTKWPYLYDTQGLEKYASIASRTNYLAQFNEGYFQKSLGSRHADARYFEMQVKRALGQQ